VTELLEDAERPRLLVRERLADVAERRGRYAGGGERRLPVGARPCAQSLGEERRELNAVAHTVWVRSEAFVVRQAERVAEPVPERVAPGDDHHRDVDLREELVGAVERVRRYGTSRHIVV